MTGRAFALVLLLALGIVSSAPAAAQTAGASTAPTDEALITTIRVNGQPKGEFFVMRRAPHDWLVRQDDLQRLGLRLGSPEAVLVEGTSHVALARIPDLSAQFDQRTLTLDLTAAARWLPRSVLANPLWSAPATPLTADRSAFLNWAVEQEASGDRSAMRLSLEAGWRDGPLLVLSRGNTVRRADGQSEFVRLDTTATYDLVQRGQRLTVGDLFTRSPALGLSVPLGGVAVSRLSSFDSFQIRHPLGSLRGQAALPSELEIFVNGQRVRSERVSPGEFELRDLPTPQGAGDIRVLIRDPYGREQVLQQSVYTSTLLLRPGLQEYHYALGRLRRSLGVRSFDYGSPVATAFHRWGLTNGLTVGLDAAIREHVHNVGASASVSLGTAGVLSGSVMASRVGAVRGHAAALRYEYVSPGWSLGLALRRDTPGYAPVGERLGFSGLRDERHLYASARIGALGSLWLARTARRSHRLESLPVQPGFSGGPVPERSQTTFGHVTGLPGLAGTLRTSLSVTNGAFGRRETELSVALTFLLDSRNLLSTGARTGASSRSQSIQWTRTRPLGVGWGADLALQRSDLREGQTLAWRGAAELNAERLRLRGEYESAHGAFAAPDRVRLSASGGMAWLDGRWHLGRPVEDAYALVKVGELAGVPVRVNGSVAGVTDASGQLFVPQVGAWYETQFSIDTNSIPIEYGLPRVERRAMLPDRSGAVIDFQLARRTAWIARLFERTPEGREPLRRAPVRLAVAGQAVESATGLEGELYLENLPPGAHVGTAMTATGPCRFTLEVPTSAEVLYDAGDLVCAP